MHVTVCICTYQRPEYLRRLLKELAGQETDGLFSYSIVVVDNDGAESAKPVVEEFSRNLSLEVTYWVEHEQSIALARNKAVQHSRGEFIAFIDDDEFPIRNWLLILFKACEQYGVDGVLGPVKPHFEQEPPSWVIKGRFHDRPTYPTGFVIDWRKGRTGNVLLKRQLFADLEQPFHRDFVTSEDQDFFRRMIEKGHSFIWCNEALAYETVPSNRWQRSFMLKKALLCGKISLRHPATGPMELLKSAVAVPLYALALPFCLLAGQHRFMQYLIKLFDHAGRLLAFVGIDPVENKYVTR